MIKVFTEWLADQADMDIGDTLFVGTRPHSADDACTVVLERGGETADPEISGIREKAIQLLTRSTSYFAARDAATAIFESIINATGVQLDGWWIHAITGLAPQYIGEDDRARHEFSTNLVIRARKESE